MNKQEEVKFTQSGFLKIDGKKRVSKFQKQGINKSAQIAKNQKRAISS